MNWSTCTLPTPRYSQYLTHGYSHITPAVAAMDSFFVLVRTHQHGIASEISLTITVRMRKVLAIPRSSRGVGIVCASVYIVVLLFMTLFKHWNCFVSSVATDDKDGRGSKKLGQVFNFNCCRTAKITKDNIVSPPWWNLFDIFFIL